MRFVEAVAAERLDLRGDLLDGALIVAARDRPLHEVAELLLNQLFDLLTHRLAQHVGFGEGVAGQRARDPHHLLLIDDHAVRRRENLFERRVRVADFLAAEFAIDEDEVHARVERPGAEQRVRRDEIVEAIALHVTQAVGGKRRFELEDPGRPARPQQRVHLGVVEIGTLEVDRDAVPIGDHAGGVVQHGECLQAEEVDLQHADFLETHHVVLRDDRVGGGGVALGIRGRTDRDIIGQRSRCDHDARRVYRGVPRQSLDARAQVEHFANALVLSGGCSHLRNFVACLGQRHAECRP